MKYNISIVETLVREIEVEADSEVNALNMVQDWYDDGYIVLDSEDHCRTDVLFGEMEVNSIYDMY